MKKRNRRAALPIDPIEGHIHALSHDGRGISTSVDGKTTFVHGALPGETVKYVLTKKHSRFNEGLTTEVIVSAADRATPPCPHFGVCGGCSMQHMKSEAQIAFKEKALLEQLLHFGHVTPEQVLPPLTGKTEGYRRKARLGVRYVEKKEKMLIGFRERSSRYLADIESCAVLHPSVGQHLMALRDVVMRMTDYQDIPQIEVAIGDDEHALVIRHMKPLLDADKEVLRDFAETHNFHLYLQPGSPDSLEKLWPEDNLYRLSYTLPDYQLRMSFHPLDFTQVNGEINPLMLKQALELLQPNSEDNILDLFSGLGNFTLPIARYAKSVVGVEGSEVMTTRASENAEANGITNATFYAADLSKIPEVVLEWMKGRYNKILLDPARTGAKEIIEYFPNWKPQRIVYVSCNPSTLARDAGILVNQLGYKLKKVGVMNMFPHTSHIEAIALFEF